MMSKGLRKAPFRLYSRRGSPGWHPGHDTSLLSSEIAAHYTDTRQNAARPGTRAPSAVETGRKDIIYV